MRDLLGKRRTRLRRPDARFRHDRYRGQWQLFGNASDASVPREADAAGDRSGEVVRVTLERQPEREQPLGVETLAVDEHRGGQAESDDRRARAEAALAGDADREVEVEAARIRKQGECADSQVVPLR